MWAYVNNLAVLITINAILAVTLNFVLGYAGIFSMAHAVFFGVGAYTTALVAMKLGGGFLLSTAAGMGLAALISLALALPALRVRGEYFIAASLGLQMLAVTVFSEWKVVTGGIGGITNIPPARFPGFEISSPAQYLAPALSPAALPGGFSSTVTVAGQGPAFAAATLNISPMAASRMARIKPPSKLFAQNWPARRQMQRVGARKNSDQIALVTDLLSADC